MAAADIRITAEPIDDQRCKFVVSVPVLVGGVGAGFGVDCGAGVELGADWVSVGGAAWVLWVVVAATGGGAAGGLRTVNVTLAVTPVRLWSLFARYTTSVCRPGRSGRRVAAPRSARRPSPASP